MLNVQGWSVAVVVSLGLGAAACSGGSSSVAEDPALDEGPDTAEDVSDLTAAKVTLRIPILDDDGKLLSRHNAALAAAKLGAFPDVVEIEGDAKGKPTASATKKWQEASALADQAAEKLKLSISMRAFAEPPDYQTRDPKTSICYRGNPLLVVNLIGNLTDQVFSDQLGIHGWRYRQKKVLEDNLTPEDEATFPSIWKNWRGKGLAILTLTASSDDGSETNVGLISKCP